MKTSLGTMYLHRKQLRRWAAGTLLLWLFGIATGIAQACLTPKPVELVGQHPAPAVAVQVQHEQAASPRSDLHQGSEHAQHDGMPGDDGSLGKSNCQDFCEKSAIAISPLKSALDNAHDYALPPVAVASVIAAAVEPAQLPLPRWVGGPALPIRLAFLRLTL